MVQLLEQQDGEYQPPHSHRHHQQQHHPQQQRHAQPQQPLSLNKMMYPTKPSSSSSPLSPSLSPLPRLTAPPPSHSQPHLNDDSSPSSISSDHTFHACFPTQSPRVPSPFPSPHALVPVPNPVVSTGRLIRDQPPQVVTKTESDAVTGFADRSSQDDVARRAAEGGSGRKSRRSSSGLRRPRTEKLLKRVGLVLRFCEVVVCLVSFSVMAADKNRGWALDSFDRYIEFRYAMSVNVIGFAYSVLQGLDLLLLLIMGKDLVRSQLRNCFDFALDQILAYLLLSSSSSAFTRVDDWISNWGEDKFPAMASASVGVSFLAFICFAVSSLISGYVLCTQRQT